MRYFILQEISTFLPFSSLSMRWADVSSVDLTVKPCKTSLMSLGPLGRGDWSGWIFAVLFLKKSSVKGRSFVFLGETDTTRNRINMNKTCVFFFEYNDPSQPFFDPGLVWLGCGGRTEVQAKQAKRWRWDFQWIDRDEARWINSLAMVGIRHTVDWMACHCTIYRISMDLPPKVLYDIISYIILWRLANYNIYIYIL